MVRGACLNAAIMRIHSRAWYAGSKSGNRYSGIDQQKGVVGSFMARSEGGGITSGQNKRQKRHRKNLKGG